MSGCCDRTTAASTRPTGWSGSPVTRPVRSVVPAEADPARGRVERAAARAGHHRRSLAVHRRADVADTQDRGPAAGLVGTDPAARTGATPVDLGQRTRHRPRRPPRHRGERVRRHARDEDRATPAERPGIQGPGRTPQRVLRDLLHARPLVRFAGGVQHPVRRLAADARTRGWFARSKPARST